MKNIIILFLNLSFISNFAFSQLNDSIPPMIIACKSNDINKVKTLIVSKTKDLDVIYDGNTPLLYAIKNENFDIAKLLIDNGCNINLSVNSITPMWYADDGNYTQKQSNTKKLILNYLIKNSLKTVPNPPSVEEIRKAIESNMQKSMNLPNSAIQFYKIYPDATYNGAIRVICDAALYDKSVMYEIIRITNQTMVEPFPEMLTHLMVQGVRDGDFQLKCNSKLEWKSELIDRISSPEIIEQLFSVIKNQTNPNQLISGFPPILYASIFGDTIIVKKLIEMGADVNVNSNGFTAIQQACIKGYLPIVKMLYAKGANLDEKSNCIFYAAQNGHDEIVKFIISKGISPNIKTGTGLTPLMFASFKGHLKVLNALINSKSDVNAIDEDKTTALIFSARYGWDKIVKVLLLKNADVNTCDKYGFTALHFACEYGFMNIVKQLLQAGANKEIKTTEGMTPSDWAKEGGYLNIVELLRVSNVKK